MSTAHPNSVLQKCESSQNYSGTTGPRANFGLARSILYENHGMRRTRLCRIEVHGGQKLEPFSERFAEVQVQAEFGRTVFHIHMKSWPRGCHIISDVLLTLILFIYFDYLFRKFAMEANSNSIPMHSFGKANTGHEVEQPFCLICARAVVSCLGSAHARRPLWESLVNGFDIVLM